MYPDEMSFVVCFTEWLLPNVLENSVEIFNNATYHNKQRDRP